MTPCTCHPGNDCASAASCAAARRVEFGENVKTTTPAMPELHRETVIAIGKKHFPKTTLSNAWFGFAADIALATLQAKPAEVSDAEIDAAWVKNGGGLNSNNYRAFARAILALRPHAVPMTERWRLLNTGERIESGDECLQDDCVTWEPLVGWEVGMTYNPHVLVPLRRRIEAHHRITAQGAQEGV